MEMCRSGLHCLEGQHVSKAALLFRSCQCYLSKKMTRGLERPPMLLRTFNGSATLKNFPNPACIRKSVYEVFCIFKHHVTGTRDGCNDIVSGIVRIRIVLIAEFHT